MSSSNVNRRIKGWVEVTDTACRSDLDIYINRLTEYGYPCLIMRGHRIMEPFEKRVRRAEKLLRVFILYTNKSGAQIFDALRENPLINQANQEKVAL